MSYAEFVHQVAYYQIAPWGDDWRQTHALAAAATSASPKYKRIDMAPFFTKPKRREQQSPEYIFGVMVQLAKDAESRRKARCVR